MFLRILTDSSNMKKWIISTSVSVTFCIFGLFYFSEFIAQDSCLDSGGRWLGVTKGCEGGNNFTMLQLMAPLPICIFIGIALGITSALVQIINLFGGIFTPKT
jgi:hypothetical protein